MRITLKHNGITVQEIDSDEIVDEITIGRGKDCVWRIPSEDTTVGRQHVKLLRHRNRVILSDLGSQNGTFCKGRRIKRSISFKPGVQATFGNCLLTVSEAKGTSGQRITTWVTVSSGRFRGEKRFITDAPFMIGSDPDSTLVLLDDMLVSRNHAKITRRDDGSCWIDDLKSTNGTRINDVPLRPGKERMLQDGDRVDIAHVEFVFHDGSAITFDWRACFRLAAMVLTLMLGVGVYQGYQRLVRKSATDYIVEARELATRRCFSEALAVLRKADSSRGIVNRRLEVESLRRLLPLWESTVNHWSEAQSNLIKGDWETSSRHLAALSACGRDAWAWDSNGDGIDTRNEALLTKDILDSFLVASNVLQRADVKSSDLLSRYSSFQNRIKAIPYPVPPYLEQLSLSVHRCLDVFRVVVKDHRAIDDTVESLKSWNPPPPLDKAVQTLEEIGERSNSKAVKERAILLVEPITELRDGVADLRRNVAMVQDLKFDEAIEFQPRIPSAECCAIHTRLSQLRENLLNSSSNLKSQTETLAALFRSAEAAISYAGFEESSQWWTSDEKENVLSCDSLQRDLPKYGDREPSGEYDRYLGVKEFFEYLRYGTQSFQTDWRGEKSRTLLSCFMDAIGRVEDLGAFLNEKDNAWLVNGKLRKGFENMKRVLMARELIVDSMKRVIHDTVDKSDRRRIIAAGIILRISSEEILVDEMPLKKWMQNELKQLRRDLTKLEEGYDYATPDRQIQIREEILRRGIPGDSIVKSMWNMKTSL